MRRYQASATAASGRSAFHATLLISATAALGLAWYTSPKQVAGYLADRLPHLFLTGSEAPIPAPAVQPTPAPLAPTAALAPIASSVVGQVGLGAEPNAVAVAIAATAADPVVGLTTVSAAMDTAAPAAPPAPTGGPIDAVELDAPLIKVVEVAKGDTLIGILLESGVARDDAVEAIDALDSVFPPKALKPGQEITLSFDQFGGHPLDDGALALASLTLQPSVERDVVVNRRASGNFMAAAIDRPLDLQVALASGTIDSSLFEAGQDAGVPVEIMSQVIKGFSYDIDFEREIQPGDHFEIVYERYEDAHGRLARTGGVLFASLVQDGIAKELYRFEPQDGAADFYNAKGESVRKELLRTPLDVVRITSTFGMRKHPILGYSKMHKGVDFAASTGTPILAAGNGVIAKLGKVRGFGNYIQIKHGAQYATAYGHMSRFAKGLKAGSKVKQGDVIGYVGSTGMATGPHLHYEVLVNGAQINPMSVKLAGRRLDGKELRRFEALKAEIKQLRKHLTESVQIARNQGR